MFNLTNKEKEEMREALRVVFGGTPFRRDSDLIISLIQPLVLGWIENRDEVFKQRSPKMEKYFGKRIKVTKIGRFFTGHDPIGGPRPICIMPQNLEYKIYCASCGKEFKCGDEYIPESDTARHCIDCIEYEEATTE